MRPLFASKTSCHWWLSEVKRDEFFAAEQRDALLSGEGNLETSKYCAGLERAYDE